MKLLFLFRFLSSSWLRNIRSACFNSPICLFLTARFSSLHQPPPPSPSFSRCLALLRARFIFNFQKALRCSHLAHISLFASLWHFRVVRKNHASSLLLLFLLLFFFTICAAVFGSAAKQNKKRRSNVRYTNVLLNRPVFRSSI